jgi:hypothetical protein
MLSKVFALQPVRNIARLYSSTSTHFLKDFMTTKEKGPVQLSIETKVKIHILTIVSYFFIKMLIPY